MSRKKKIAPDLSTEEKIISAARSVFTKKGFAATRTRDIAKEAGINLAMVNYYFRSKEKLFEIIMFENFQKLFGIISPIFKDETTRLETKVELIAFNYIKMLSENSDLPVFVLNEMNRNPQFLTNMIGDPELQNSSFTRQLRKKYPDLNPGHFFLNLMGMTVFPFIVKPAFPVITGNNHNDFMMFMEDRKKLIPLWVDSILKTNKPRR